MEKLFMIILTTVGSGVGWWAGSKIGFMSAFALSIVGTGLGLYLSRRIIRDYF
jgi:hypothetical protein